jgi:ribosome biogenesis GTPase / thiamine phosphate phosphatase
MHDPVTAQVAAAATVSPSPANLDAFGWSAELALAHAPHLALGRVPARVVAEDRGSYQLIGDSGHLRASVSGRFRHEAMNDPSAYPAVGDWVAVDGGATGDAVIHAILPRRSALVRQASGKRTEAQVVGANLDVVFVVASLNADLNVRRLERYLAAAWESGAQPVILLSKADLGGDADTILSTVAGIAAGAAVVIVSSFDGRGVDEVREWIKPGRTVAFVGSSGVGKSTLLNRLAGEERAIVREIREDDARGRHTTIRRQLHLLPDGGMVIGSSRPSVTSTRSSLTADSATAAMTASPAARLLRPLPTEASTRIGSKGGGSSSARPPITSDGSTRLPAPRSAGNGRRSANR